VLRNEDSWDEFTWRAALQWSPADAMMLYASASTGFRSGAYAIGQGDPELLDQAVGPESVESYEVGLKSRWFDDRVQLNLTAFDATYDDLQFFVQSAGTLGVAQTTNAGEATMQGVELELLWSITPELTTSMYYVYQTGDSDDIPEAAQEDVPPGTPPAGTVPHAWGLQLDYLRPWRNGELSFHVDYSHKDEYTLEFVDNRVPGLRSETDALVGVSLGYRSQSGWGVEAWVDNVFDEDIVLYGQDFWFGVYDVFTAFVTNPEVQSSSWGPRYGDPRTYGVTISYEF
jgi:iron complex outermembrane receptor protein